MAELSEMIHEALKDRPPDDIAVIWCDSCGKLTYYNQGSHCTCDWCNASLDHLIDGEDAEFITLADVWDAEDEDFGIP